MKKKYEFWFGDENSLSMYLQVIEKSMNPELLSGKQDNYDSSLLSSYGNVAVVSIQGGIHSTRNWLTDMLGIPTYPGIRDALVEAANNDNIDHILLDINSPGGSASGIEDISTLMQNIDKPITAYTNGTMASAAYWIGATADQVYASNLSTVGSIGVIATHFDLTKQLENDGVKATIFRSGEFKALGGPYEALTSTAKEIIQSRLDTLYEAFVSHVADSRHVSTKTVHDKMADGREFLGHEALKAGLIDGIMSIDELMTKLQSSTKPSTGRTQSTRMEASDMKKKLLNQQAAAVLEAGGSLETALEVAEEVEQTTEVEAVPADVVEEVVEEEVAAEASAESGDALTTYLKTELASANEKLIQATMESRNLQAQLDGLNATHTQLRSIVIDSTNIKRVALGGSNSDLSSLSDEALLQQHQQASAEFSKTFPIGGKVAAPSVEQPTVSVAHNHQARIGAVRATKS